MAEELRADPAITAMFPLASTPPPPRLTRTQVSMADPGVPVDELHPELVIKTYALSCRSRDLMDAPPTTTGAVYNKDARVRRPVMGCMLTIYAE